MRSFRRSRDPKGRSLIEQLWPFKLSDRFTLHSAPKQEGVAAITTDAELQAGFVNVGGEGGLGAPRMAASGRLAIAPAMAASHCAPT